MPIGLGVVAAATTLNTLNTLNTSYYGVISGTQSDPYSSDPASMLFNYTVRPDSPSLSPKGQSDKRLV